MATTKESALDIDSVGRPKLKNREYLAELRRLRMELAKLQECVKLEGIKICVVLEGRDGAGKGGTIKALTERRSPCAFRVVALPAPTDRVKTQMYMSVTCDTCLRPAKWRSLIAVVTAVLGTRDVFLHGKQVHKFLNSVPPLERAIVDSGMILHKYWLEVSVHEQIRRLKARIKDGRKTWKLSPADGSQVIRPLV